MNPLRALLVLIFAIGLPGLCRSEELFGASHVTQHGVSVAVALYGITEVHALFGSELEEIDPEYTQVLFGQRWPAQGIDVLWLRIENHSDQLYTFQKATLAGPYVSARALAKRLQRPEHLRTEVVLRPLLAGPRQLFAIPGFVAVSLVGLVNTARPYGATAARPLVPIVRACDWLVHVHPRVQRFNKTLRDVLMRAEIPDVVTIRREGLVVGYVFLPHAERTAPLRVMLIDTRTQQPLIFEMPALPVQDTSLLNTAPTV